MKRSPFSEQELQSPSWLSFKQQQQEVLFTGAGSIFDNNWMQVSLGISAATASPTVLAIALFSTAIGAAKSGFTGEWTTTNTNYARVLAGTTSGIGTANWAVTLYAGSAGAIATNSNTISFAAASGTAFGTINVNSVAVVDSITRAAGNIWWMADVAQQGVAAGVIVQFNGGSPGDILLTLN